MAKRVPPVGPIPCDLMFVGEGPGRQEVQQGRPFVGPAGTVLDKACAAAGISRDRVFITNITDRMPDWKSKDEFFVKDNQPTEVYLEGIARVAEEIKRVQPKAIVAFGNWALFGLTGLQGITRYRGSILPCMFDKKIKVVPTLHPSFIQRGMWHKMPLMIWDLVRAAKESQTSEWDLPDPTLIINPSDEVINDRMEYLLTKADHITYDTEWFSPDEISCIGFTDSPEWGIVVPASHPRAFEIYRALLENDKPKVAQNAMFDATILHRLGIEVGGKHDDTMIAHHHCWTDLREKGLDTLCSIYTKMPYYKDEIKIWGQTGDLDTLYLYNGKDIVVTEESWRVLDQREFKYTGTRKGYDIVMSIFDTMKRSTNFGIRGDREALHQMREDLLTRANNLEKAIFQQVGMEFNSRSSQQVAHVIYDVLGVKRGHRSTAHDKLVDIAASETNPVVKAVVTAVVKIRADRNLVSRYLQDDVIDPDGRIRCAWNLAGTKNGRLSTNKTWWGSGLPLQTVPDRTRRIFVADEGHVFIGWDLEQAEARLVAYLSHDDDLIEDMNTPGVDIHRRLASQLPFGLSYEQLLAMPKDCRERTLAKKCRHALNYQMGPLTFKDNVNEDYLETGVSISAAEAKLLRKRYLDIHYNLSAWWKEVESELAKNGSLTNPLGRRRRFFGQWGGELFRDATAFVPQSTVGDLTTIAIARIDRSIGNEGGEGWAIPLIHMHDGGLIQVPEDKADECIERVKETMHIPINIAGYTGVTIPVEVFVGRNWQYYDEETNPDGLKKVA